MSVIRDRSSIRVATLVAAVSGSLLCATPGAATTIDSAGARQTLVAFGDSLTAGLGVPVNEAYPARLEQRLREEGFAYNVINAGVSGDTTAGGLRRVEWILQTRPHIVILALGANDGLRGLPPERTQDNLAQIIERFQAAGATVVLAGMRVPPNYGDDYASAFATIYPELARRYDLTLIPFFLEGVAANPALNQSDGIHPNAAGYQVIVDRIWPILLPLLTR